MNRTLFSLALSAICLTISASAGGNTGGDQDNCLAGKTALAIQSASRDESTGRDLRNYPPDRLVDYLHMKLQMRFEDLNDMQFTATETLTVKPIGTPVDSLTLDAVNLDIHRAQIAGRTIEHYHDGQHLTLRFSPPLQPDTESAIEIEYTCDHPVDGMFFTPSSPDAPDYTAEVHTQGQPESNRYWFIAHDFPNERMTTELIVNVPARCSVSSNGRLESHLNLEDRSVWHYLQDKSHVSYLVSLVIGEFDIVEIPHSRVPMKVWVPKGKGDLVMDTYGRTGAMIDCFEKHFGVPYPWDRYDQLVIKNFGAGGMENTSVTSMYPTALFDPIALRDGDMDGLISHELCHQWTGDLLTCKSWAHIWLNEGWATFGNALWMEERDGEDAYLDNIRGSFGVARRDKTTGDLPMVSLVYDHPWEVFRRTANPYPKGSSILHMLRMMLGEEVFWNGVHLYMNRHKFGVVETSDFRYALEEVSGKGLEWFFTQWCDRPGTPKLEVETKFDPRNHELQVSVEQKQKIDDRTPAFRFTLPIHATTANGTAVFNIEVTEQSTHFRTILDGIPTQVAVDPFLHVLKTITVNKPHDLWIEQAKHGVTIVARHAALEALRDTDSPATIALCAEIIRDDSTRHTLRNTAVDTLASYGSDDAKSELLAILDGGIDDPRVRSSLVGHLDNYTLDEVLERVVQFASTDSSYNTRQAAIRDLVQLKAEDQGELLANLVHFPSQHDRVRTTALNALADLDDESGLALAMQYSAYGNTDRARAQAVSVVGRLGHFDPDTAVPFLIDLLDDPESRTVTTAMSALAKIGDERALAPLRAIAKSHRNPDFRETAENQVKALEKKLQESKKAA